MKNKKKYDSSIVDTLIGKDCLIHGKLHTQKSIQLEGSFEGEINSKGEVYIVETAQCRANIIARDVIVSGEVIGNIEAIKSLKITETGRVYGNISGDHLLIEEGGIYKGKVNMDVISSKSATDGENILKAQQ